MDDKWILFKKGIRGQGGDKSGSLLPDIRKKQIRKELQAAFRLYRYGRLPEERRVALECLVGLHAEVCRDNPADGGRKRRHNALVFRYMDKRRLGNQEIADQSGLCKCALNLELIRVLDELAVMLAGIPFVLGGGESPEETVRAMVKNYSLLRACHGTDLRSLFPEGWQPDIIKARESTSFYWDRLGWCILQYGEYCRADPAEARRYRVLMDVMVGRETVGDMAVAAGYSPRHIYRDVKKNYSRLGELFMA